MQKIHFSIIVNAPVEKVWQVMFDENTYREWASVFSEGSTFKGNWEKGSKMLFLGPDPESGTEMGMVSEIAENKPNEFMSIKHLGIYANGVEDTTSDEAKKWAPAFENYTFINNGDSTEVQIDQDMQDEYVEMFNDMWPKALEKLKMIAERVSI